MSTIETKKEEGMVHQTKIMKKIGTKCTITETRGTIMETGEMTTETGESTAIQSRWVMATIRRRGGMQTQELLNT